MYCCHGLSHKIFPVLFDLTEGVHEKKLDKEFRKKFHSVDYKHMKTVHG